MSESEKAQIKHEVQDDLPFITENEFITPSKEAEGYWRNAEIVWVRKVAGRRYGSLEQFFKSEHVSTETCEELHEIRKRLENARLFLTVQRMGKATSLPIDDRKEVASSKARAQTPKIAVAASSPFQMQRNTISFNISSIVDVLYEFVSERSTSIEVSRYFQKLSEDEQLRLGLELLALRLWAVHQILLEMIGNEERQIITNKIDRLLQADFTHIFEIIENSMVCYIGMGGLSDPVRFVSSSFAANIKEIIDISQEVAADQTLMYLKEVGKYVSLWQSDSLRSGSIV